MKSVAQTVIEADRFYTIAAKTGSVIQAVENAKDGGDIRLGKYDHKPEQEWAFIRVGDGVYRIRNRANGKLMDLMMTGTANGTWLHLWEDVGGTSQMWTMEHTPQGTVRLRSSWAGGKCVDTSMGLTPLAGLPMGTRAGDMDVGVIEYVANKYDRSISSVMEGLNKRSGMMGLSGVSSDFRDLEAAAAKGHHRSAIALRIFEYRVHKMIAEYAAAMNGVDVVIFTAGVGENAPSTRAHILEGLEFMGITCDEEKNNTRGEERIISKDGAPVTVMVIPTNEELMIAQDTLSIVEENKNK